MGRQSATEYQLGDGTKTRQRGDGVRIVSRRSHEATRPHTVEQPIPSIISRRANREKGTMGPAVRLTRKRPCRPSSWTPSFALAEF
jgi:hypothetical protein